MRRSACAVLLGWLLCLPSAQAHSHHAHADAALPGMAYADLRPEARTTLQRIRQHGPFPYARDGVVFGNYEHALPQRPRGEYHEYTVPTPGAHNRGARRIVCDMQANCYYSENHYRNFYRIMEER